MLDFPKHVRVAFRSTDDLTLFVTADGTPIYKDAVRFLFFFSKILNFTFTVVVPEDRTFGNRLNNGTWTGMYGMMQRGEADLSFEILGLSELSPFDYALPIGYDRVTFLTQWPRPVPKNLIFFKPFSFAVWIVFGLCTIAFVLTFGAMSIRSRQCVRNLPSTLGNVLGQPFYSPMTTRSQKILFVGWIFATSILIHAFKATFLSFLLVVPTKGIRTFDELASALEDESVTCRGYKDNFLINILLAHTDESHRIIGHHAEENSREAIIPREYFDPNSVQRTAFIGFEKAFRSLKKVMLVSEDSFFHAMFAFPIRKNFRGRKVLDATVKRMFEAGLIQKVDEDCFFRFELSERRRVPYFTIADDGEKRISLEDLRGGFAVLGVGLGSAFLVLLGELLFFYCKELRSKTLLKTCKIQIKTVVRAKQVRNHSTC